MKRIIPLILSLLASLACMGSLCDISSHNGPQNINPIDTMQVQHFDTLANVSITVMVREYDKSIQKAVPTSGANVHFINSDTSVITDSTGNASAYFKTDSLPFQYKYEVTKNGFEKYYYKGKGSNLRINDNVLLHSTM